MIHLNKISQKLPIALYVGMQDQYADQTDVKWLHRQLGNRVKQVKTYNNFDHFSFQIGKDMSYTDDVVDLLKDIYSDTYDQFKI